MSFGKGSNTTTSTSAPNPAAMAAYNTLLTQAGNVAQTPFTPYSGEFAAPVNTQQQTGIAGVNANANYALPVIQQAQGFATQAAQPITASQIQQYQNPFTSQVVNATQAQFNNANAQQQAQLTGNAAAQGALGGDRVGVAQAILAGQQSQAQAPVIAGLESQGYTTGLQTALAEQQNTGNAAYSLGNLGVAGEQAALSGAGAQIGAGTLEQQTQQAQDTALYNQFMMQQAYPFQTTQWLAGIDTGVGSQMGGTSSTTPPAPNPWNTVAGLGIAALGAFAKDGGRVKGFALGGAPYADVESYVPTLNITGGQGAPKPPGVPSQQNPLGNLSADAKAGKGAGNLLSGFGGDSGTSDYAYQAPEGLGDFTPTYLPGFGYMPTAAKSGGPIMLPKRKGFDSGGDVAPATFDERFTGEPFTSAGFGTGSIMPPLSFEDRAGPVQEAIRNGTFDPQGDTYTTFAKALPPISNTPTSVADNSDLPPIITRGSDASPPIAGLGAGDDEALAYSGEAPTTGFAGSSPAAADTPSRGGLLSGLGLNLSPEGRMGLIAAGLGMMASRSPYLGQAIGEGGLQGLGEYSSEQKQALATKKTEADIEHGKNALAQQAKLAQDRIAIETKKLAAEQEHWTQQLSEQHFHNQMSLRAPVNLGADPRTGMPIMAIPRPNQSGGLDYYMIGPNGQISDTPIGAPAASPANPAPAPGAPVGPTSALPSSPANAAQPVRTAALETGTATDAPRPGEGLVQYNTRLAQAGGVDYGTDAPYIEKGMDVPEPSPLAGRSVQALKTDAEYFLETGKLPPVVRGNSPVAMVQQRYQNAVKNYAGALAQSRGMSPQEVSEAWRTAPGMLRFILGADGRSTVSLGTAVRHLDTMKQLVDAWKQGSTIGDWRTWNQVTSSVRREFGDASVTNLQSAAKIIGPEIIKAIGVAGAGGEREREAVEQIYSPSSTPDQIAGAIGTVQSLLGGQLEGRERQAVNAGVSHERFRSLIGDRPYELLSHTGSPGAPAPGAGAPRTLAPQDQQALDWAAKNPADPRAAAIKKRLGVP